MEQKSKDRYLAAGVFIAMAVILIPWLLEKPKDDPFKMAEALPQSPAWPSAKEVLEGAHALDLSIAIPEEVAAMKQDAELPDMPVMDGQISNLMAKIDRKIQALKSAESAKSTTAPVTVDPSTKMAFSVQLGIFSDEKNAKNLQDVLRKAGYAAYTVNVSAQKGKVIKVMVGPTVQRSDAEKVLARLESDYQMKGMIVPYSPIEP